LLDCFFFCSSSVQVLSINICNLLFSLSFYLLLSVSVCFVRHTSSFILFVIHYDMRQVVMFMHICSQLLSCIHVDLFALRLHECNTWKNHINKARHMFGTCQWESIDSMSNTKRRCLIYMTAWMIMHALSCTSPIANSKSIDKQISYWNIFLNHSWFISVVISIAVLVLVFLFFFFLLLLFFFFFFFSCWLSYVMEKLNHHLSNAFEMRRSNSTMVRTSCFATNEKFADYGKSRHWEIETKERKSLYSLRTRLRTTSPSRSSCRQTQLFHFVNTRLLSCSIVDIPIGAL
jgi:hypothetical protein